MIVNDFLKHLKCNTIVDLLAISIHCRIHFYLFLVHRIIITVPVDATAEVFSIPDY